MTEQTQEHRFSWAQLGNLTDGRPTLGPQMRIEVYRLMQFTLRDVMERHYGVTATDAMFYEAGYLAGRNYYEHIIGPVEDLQDFVKRVSLSLQELGVGILAMEESDPSSGRFVITVSEDLDCAGLPVAEYPICTYDEGFIAALLESFSGCKYVVREVDCWTTGARICRFIAQTCREVLP